MIEVSLIDVLKKSSLYEKKVILPFYKDGNPLEKGGRWGMSLRSARSMRFRWNEVNENRTSFLTSLTQTRCKKAVSLELIHSKTVYDLKDGNETEGKTGDGMISKNPGLVPVVTVADCMPLFLFDPVTGVFGVFHSGWKGTGIIKEGIDLAVKNYGVRVEDVCVAIGPHIHRCCYTVDEERADYFSRNFTPDAVSPTGEYNENGKRLFSLGLLEANLSVLRKAGVREENIVAARECTSCSSCALTPGSVYYPFGSFRREAAFQGESLPAEKKSRLMTVQAAFCGFLEP